MKLIKYLALVLITVSTLNSAFAKESTVQCKLNASIESQEVARRGCCSHHGGVCGCGGYRLRCCDGTLSPSCECHHDDTENSDLPNKVENYSSVES